MQSQVLVSSYLSQGPDLSPCGECVWKHIFWDVGNESRWTLPQLAFRIRNSRMFSLRCLPWVDHTILWLARTWSLWACLHFSIFCGSRSVPWYKFNVFAEYRRSLFHNHVVGKQRRTSWNLSRGFRKLAFTKYCEENIKNSNITK